MNQNQMTCSRSIPPLSNQIKSSQWSSLSIWVFGLWPSLYFKNKTNVLFCIFFRLCISIGLYWKSFIGSKSKHWTIKTLLHNANLSQPQKQQRHNRKQTKRKNQGQNMSSCTVYTYMITMKPLFNHTSDVFIPVCLCLCVCIPVVWW